MLQIYGQPVFDKDSIAIQWRKDCFLTNGSGKKWVSVSTN
jgi:hypothetical protein